MNTTPHRTELLNGAGARLSALCAVTIARAVKPRIIMAKVVNVDEDGMITGVEPSQQGFLFEFREAEVRDLESLSGAIAAAARDPYSIVVRGKPKQAVGRRAMYDDADAGPANLTVTPRRWVAFDWDDIPVPHDPESIEHDQASSPTGPGRRRCSSPISESSWRSAPATAVPHCQLSLAGFRKRRLQERV